MTPAHALCAIDLFLCDLMDNHHPFGGNVMVLAGDFQQVPSVFLHATQTAIVLSLIVDQLKPITTR